MLYFSIVVMLKFVYDISPCIDRCCLQVNNCGAIRHGEMGGGVALVHWLREETCHQKAVSLNPNTGYWMENFHINSL